MAEKTVTLLVVLAAYIAFSRLALSVLKPPARQIAFSLANIFALAFIFSWGAWYSFLGLYIGLVLLEFVFIRKADTSRPAYYISIFFPITLLVLIKYVPESTQAALEGFGLAFKNVLPAYFIGISYMAFRLSQLAVELRAKAVQKPDIWEYLAFAFFIPAIPIGPITTFKTFCASFRNMDRSATPWTVSSGRILIGATKYFFLASMFNQLSFDGLMKDGNLHQPLDFAIAGASYYMFLYFNFSGFCDMAIGAAGLMGIRLDENFDNPILSRNIQDFWNRWHITLGAYMRQMVFVPLSKAMVMRLGQASTNFCIGVTIFVIFILIGIWHGKGLQYVLFGFIHAVGVLAAFLYGNWLKKRLGRERYSAYLSNPWITNAARIATFAYVSLSMAVFANSPGSLYMMIKGLQW